MAIIYTPNLNLAKQGFGDPNWHTELNNNFDKIDARINQYLLTSSSPTFSGAILSGLTPGSIVFAGTGGVLSQDNANLFWDNTKKMFGLGISPSALCHIKGNLTSALTGTVSVTQNSNIVTGTGTLFTSELKVGDAIKIKNEIFTVSGIASDTSLTLDSNYLGTSASGLTAYTDPTLFSIDNGNSVNKLVITKSGYVGINTTPIALFHVKAIIGERFYFQSESTGLLSPLVLWNSGSGTSVGAGFLFAAGSPTNWIGGIASQLIDTSNSRTVLRVISNGSLTSPDTNAPIYIEGSATGVKTVITTRLGIKQAIPSYDLHLLNDSAAKPTTNTWTISSDRRLKENIKKADINRCYEIIKTIPLMRYGYKRSVYNDGQIKDRNVLGWLADDVEKVFPKAVSVNRFESDIEKIEDCKYVNNDQMFIAMYGALQKVIEKIEDLERRIIL